MPLYLITTRATGIEMGIFNAETEAAALDLMAVDAGYRSFADQCARLGQTAEDTADALIVDEIPTDRPRQISPATGDQTP